MARVLPTLSSPAKAAPPSIAGAVLPDAARTTLAGRSHATLARPATPPPPTSATPTPMLAGPRHPLRRRDPARRTTRPPPAGAALAVPPPPVDLAAPARVGRAAPARWTSLPSPTGAVGAPAGRGCAVVAMTHAPPLPQDAPLLPAWTTPPSPAPYGDAAPARLGRAPWPATKAPSRTARFRWPPCPIVDFANSTRFPTS
nr:classical arabinogalactan protein 9-like [Setaria viridis]